MAITFLKRSEMPVAVKGKTATAPIVTITGVGQVRLNKLALEMIGTPKSVMWAFNVTKENQGQIMLFKTSAPLVAKAKIEEKDFTVISYGKVGDDGKQKTNDGYFSASAMLRTDKVSDYHYDFKASGDQKFTPVYDAKNECMVINVPNGALAKRPVVARKKKAKVAPGTAANPGSVSGIPVGGKQEVELDLEASLVA